MKKYLAPLACAAAFVATPAMANDFAGPRVEVNAGFDDVTGGVDTTDIAYGAALGYDLQFGKVVLGAEGTVAVNSNLEKPDLGAAARLGYAVKQNVLVFGRAGYSNLERPLACTTARIPVCTKAPNLEGLTVGGGVEVNLAGPAFVKAEYRYTDFANSGVGRHGAVVGVGLRF